MPATNGEFLYSGLGCGTIFLEKIGKMFKPQHPLFLF